MQQALRWPFLPWSILPGAAPAPCQTWQSQGTLGSRTRSRQSPPADGGGGDDGTETPISTLYLLQGPLAVTFKRQGGLAARELAVGACSRQMLCRTIPAGPGTPGWELSERSWAHRLRVSAWLPLSFSALPCLQLSLGATLSPLPASFSLRRAILPAASSAPQQGRLPSGTGRLPTPFHGPFRTGRDRGAVSPGSPCRGICKKQ